MVLIPQKSDLAKVVRSCVASQRGFSLVELITVLVIVGVLAATVSSRFMPSALLELQAARDQLVSALFVAQQNAMAQSKKVQLTTAGNTIDIRIDYNGDGQFSANESLEYGGTRYPLLVSGGTRFSQASLQYDRNGHTQSGAITATLSAHRVEVIISGTGYAY